MPVKLLTSGGGGVNLVPSSSIASDQTMYLPTSGTSGGTVLCTDSTGGTANGVLYLNSSKQVTSGSGLVFDSSGNLGIGTSSPATKLSVFKNGQNTAWSGTSISDAGLNIDAGNTGGGYTLNGINFTANTQTAFIYNYSLSNSSSNLAFGTNGSERMRLDSSGNLIVGGTSGSSHVFVKNRADYDVLGITNSSNLGSEGCITSWLGSNSVNTSSRHYEAWTNSIIRFVVYGNGNVQNTNNSYSAISDQKLKENIVDASPKLEDICKVKVRNFNLIDDENKLKQIGVVAQELEEVFPSMVDETPDYEEVTKTRTIDIPAVLDEEGNEVEPATTKEEEYTERVATGTTTKSVKYSVFVPMLIKAVQEQQTIIESLTQRIEALEYTKQGE